jgi:TonB family protein
MASGLVVTVGCIGSAVHPYGQQRQNQVENDAAIAAVQKRLFGRTFEQTVELLAPSRLSDVKGRVEATWPFKISGRQPYRGSVPADPVAVVLELIIDTKGMVRNARVLRSNAAFDDAAMEVVRRWKYAPFTVDGKPVTLRFAAVVYFDP